MRKRLASIVMGSVLAASSLSVLAPRLPAGAQANFPGANFSGYSTGAVVHTDAVTLSGTRVADAEQAFSGQATNSTGLGNQIVNEMDVVVQPALADRNSYGQGTGLQVGVLTSPAIDPGENQVLLAGLAQASAPPSSDLVRREIGPVSLPPVAYASVLRGEAQAAFNNTSCVIGKPLGYGSGYAADAQLLGLGTAGPGGELGNPLVALDNRAGDSVAHSRSYSYLVPNGDGTFGLASETRQLIAPVTLFKGQPNELTIQALGEWVLRATATGKPGGASITYAPAGSPTPTTPILRIIQGAAPALDVTFQQIFGTSGLTLPANPVLDLAIGEDPRAIGGDAASSPTVAANGTSASAAVDVVRVGLLSSTTGTAVGLEVLDVRIGHMEAQAVVPEGGIRCNIPVNKTVTPNPVQAGQEFTYTITIPSSPEAFADFACDLINVRATDTMSVLNGNVRFEILEASNGGVISGNTVTFDDLGTYTRGGPPITATIRARAISGAGTIQNVVNVTANAGNCTGGAAGQQLVGDAQITGVALTGTFTLVGPGVGGGAVLPRTGSDDTARLALGLGIMALAGAAWAVRFRSRRLMAG